MKLLDNLRRMRVLEAETNNPLSENVARTKDSKDVALDYHKQVVQALVALDNGNFKKFGKIVTSVGTFIMQNEDIHAACVAVLEKTLDARNYKVANRFCKAVSDVLPTDETSAENGKTVLNDLVTEASEKVLTRILDADKINRDKFYFTMVTLVRMGYGSTADFVASRVAQNLIIKRLETGRNDEAAGIAKITSCLLDCSVDPALNFQEMKDAYISGLVRAACYSQNEALNAIMDLMWQREPKEKAEVLREAYDLAVNKSLQQGNVELSENAKKAFDEMLKKYGELI